MKKIWNGLTKDLWIVLLDILVVNFAYFLAVLVRFYIKSFEFRSVMGTYMNAWATFAPFYTVLCVAVFALFSLYGGMWRYAGINDMNRVIGANGSLTGYGGGLENKVSLLAHEEIWLR